ncbi:heparin lyase I family protein [Bosea lathyri]|uniref:Polysaccharide lyase n=1 Tax=Bosea lathyri TaxID=1036778 RepID=A0A1H6BHB6_9HYPH|nr:heparin lyase I family protein [Bosea lathyri]SEG59785.1 Polysaccharide lyase [Bosea lathyri]
MAASSTQVVLAPNTKFDWSGASYWIQDAGKNYSLTEVDSDTLRFEVRSGDVWSQVDSNSINRSEIASTVQIANGTPIHISYEMNIEQGGSASCYWTVLGQFHQNDYEGAPSNSPPFAISLSNGKMTVVIGYTAASGQTVYKTVYTDTADVLQNHDYKFDIDIVFDPNGNGHLNLIRDGVKIVEYDGPLGYSTQSSVYWKQGIYRPESSETMAVSYSDLSLTTGAPIALAPTKLDTQYKVNQYGSDGKLATTTLENPDGSMSVQTFDSAGLLASMVTRNLDGTKTTLFYDAYGTMTQKVLTSADNSRVVDTFAITGKTYTSEHAVYDKTGAATSLTRYLADGQVELQQKFGTYAVTTYYQYDAAGHQTLKSVTQVTGAREVFLSHVEGKDYTSEHRIYDTSGAMTKLLRYHDDGTLAYTQMLGGSGATTYTAYDAAGALLRKSVVQANGARELFEYGANDAINPVAHMTYDSAGTMLTNTQHRADGNTVIYHYNITGQSYASDAITYDPSGKIALIVRYHADKTLDYKQQVGADGSTTYQKYDAAGTLKQKTVVDLDGSKDVYDYGVKDKGYTSSLLSYDEKGALKHMVQYWDDGAQRVSDFGITGKSYVTENVTYNAAHIATSVTRYHADGTPDYVHSVSADGSSYSAFYDALGKQTLAISTKADGSQVVKSYAADVVMTSGGGNDSFTSFGSDKFVFHPDFGNDTIYGFKAGDSPAHDTLQFDKAVVADYAHLNMVQHGADVVITATPHDIITLKGVALASLTANDFLFV